MTHISPVEVRVQCDWISGRPHTLHLAHEAVRILALSRLRHEAAAHPASVGPRTLFVVETAAGRYELVYEHRRRRWILDGVESYRPADSGRPHTASAGRGTVDDVLPLPWAA